MKSILLLIALCPLIALGADISGTWKGTAELQGRTIERTFTFKVDGNRVTGESSSQMMGKSVIIDGKIDGDTVTFTIKGKIQDNEMTLRYTGRISGNEIRFHVVSDGGMELDYLAKKIS